MIRPVPCLARVERLEERALLSSFSPGNVVVYRVGTGTGALVNTGNAVFLDEYSPTGSLVQSIALPTTGAGSQQPLIASGTATSEGGLTLSGDSRYLLAPGYAATPGGVTSLPGSTSGRVVGRIDSTGTFDTSTVLTDINGNNPRSATSDNGTNIWVGSSSGGVRYTTFGTSGSSTQISTTVTNVRFVEQFDGQLYVSTGSGTAVRVGTVGTGLPTTGGQTITNLPGFPTSGSPYAYFLADLTPAVAGIDTLYVADDGAAALSKYSLVSGNWSFNSTVGSSSDSYRGLTASVSGSTVTLFATRKGGSGPTGGGELVKLVDTSGYNAAINGTALLLATASSNTAFRGVAFAPTGSAVSAADLTVAVSAPGAASIGSSFDYTVSVGNVGGTGATGVVAQFTLPVNLNYVSSILSSGFSASFDALSRVVTFQGGTVGASSTVPLMVTVTPTSFGTYTVPVGGAVVDPAGLVAESNESNNSSTAVVTTVVAPSTLRIRDIQDSSHTSPLVGQVVSNIPGIVTAVRSNGFNLQDPTSDTDDSTSEAIFVFTGSAPTVSVGQSVLVSGTVIEFQPGGVSARNLTQTEIVSPTVSVVSSGNPLPSAVVIGIGGRVPPTAIIDDDSFSLFDPASDGIDFYESLEGMRVQVNNAVATGPTNGFGEISVLADNGSGASLRTTRGGIIVQPGDFNPERIILDDVLAPTPNVNTGASFSTILGVMDYSFGNFKLYVTATPTASGGVIRETTTLVGATDALTVASFNAENLDPGDGATKFKSLAAIIVNNLQAPDILTLEEVQDNNGATNNGVVDASITYQALINAIAAAGGPTYQFRQINPVNNQDGGEPGGNIRVAFLFNPSRVTFVDRPGGSSTSSTFVQNVGGTPQLSASPGRIDPNNSAFNSSRKPLVGEFQFAGETLFVIANHWNSKGGDQPLFGNSQPPVLSSELQRNEQAQIVQDFVQSILTVDANARIVWGGDLNDFYFSNPAKILTGVADLSGANVVPNGNAPILIDLVTTLPASERYSYVFDGNSQDLDHILASNRLVADGAQFDAVHVNSEFYDQISDHDPLVSRYVFQFAPTSISLSNNSIAENSPAETAIGTLGSTDFNIGDTATFTLADDAGGRFAVRNIGGVSTLVSTAPLDYEQAASYNIVVRTTDTAGKFLDQPFVITVANVIYELTGFDVQRGQTQRSFVRYADLSFQDTTTVALQNLISAGKVQLLYLGLSGSGGSLVNLAGKISASGGQLNFDAGTQGIGGNRNSNAGDGFYRFQLDLDGNGSFETTRTFFRLFGDVNGDRQTTLADRNLIPAVAGPYNAELDVNGDGVVDARDRIAIKTGRSLTPSIAIDD